MQKIGENDYMVYCCDQDGYVLVVEDEILTSLKKRDRTYCSLWQAICTRRAIKSSYRRMGCTSEQGQQSKPHEHKALSYQHTTIAVRQAARAVGVGQKGKYMLTLQSTQGQARTLCTEGAKPRCNDVILGLAANICNPPLLISVLGFQRKRRCRANPNRPRLHFNWSIPVALVVQRLPSNAAGVGPGVQIPPW